MYATQTRGKLMFPEPVAMPIREPQSADGRRADPATAGHTAHAGAAKGGAASPNQIQAALRIRAALRAAHQDVAGVQLPAGQSHEWTWTVKAPPRPPLVVDSISELNSEELLANDSLGG